jgi:GT2 family glycosyltransferase
VLLSVVTVNWNSRDDLAACLASLERQTHRELEVIVVDNGSTDGSLEMLAERFPDVTVMAQGENLGFAEACNRGIAKSHGAWVALLNNDAIAEPAWAEELVRAAETAPDTCGMLQSLMLFFDRPTVINSAGVELTASGGGRDRLGGRPRAEGESSPEEIFCPCGGAAAYRRTMLDELRGPHGYFDAAHFMYYEDLDLGWRAQLAGYTALYVPTSVVLHRHQASTKRRGREWLTVLSLTNRVRTLVKNASPRFLLRTMIPNTGVTTRIVWYGGVRGAVGLGRALRDAVKLRRRVDKSQREAVERRWVVG